MTSCFKGIKFFDRNIAIIQFGGTATASSASDDASDSFNGKFGIGWQSIDEADDTVQSWLLRRFDSVSYGDTVFIANHNLKDLQLYINDVLVEIMPTQKQVGASIYTCFSFPYREDIETIKIAGSATTEADNEKSIGEVLLLTTLGQFKQPQSIRAPRSRRQANLELQNGNKFIFQGGAGRTIKLEIFSLNQDDIDLFEKIQELQGEFFVWPCGGDEGQYSFHYRPYKFEDLIKVGVASGNDPELKDNYYRTGLRDSLELDQVE